MEKRTTFFDKKELSKRDQDFIDADNKEQLNEKHERIKNNFICCNCSTEFYIPKLNQQALEERSVERINKYARHQFNRASMGLSLIPFEEWASFPNP